MKNFLLVLCILWHANTSAQPHDYYAGQTSVKGDEYTYVLDKSLEDIGVYIIFNANNECLHEDTDPNIDYGYASMLAHDLINQILKEGLTKEQLNALHSTGPSFTFHFAVDEAGDTKEVQIAFPRLYPYCTVSPRQWEQIEKRIKSQIKWRVSAPSEGMYILMTRSISPRYLQ